MAAALRVLVVDGDVAELRAFAKSLFDAGFTVVTAESVGAAVPLALSREQDAVLVDVTSTATADALAKLVEAARGAGVVLIASSRQLGHAAALAEREAHDVLAKPVAHELLHLAVRRAAKLAEVTRELSSQAIVPAPPRLVGTGRVMRALLSGVPRVAASALPALIVGEPGTGKRTWASLLHQRGPRRTRPLLFVHAADTARAGFPTPGELAGGTMVVEALSELPRARQGELLAMARARAEHRVIALATPDLRALAQEDAGLRDLFHGLAAHLIELPPLRRRRDDLSVLAQEALVREAGRQGSRVRRIGPEALKKLAGHPWPGNLRELDAAIARAVAKARGEVLLPKDIDLDEHEPAAPAPDAPPERLPASLLDLGYADAKAQAMAVFHRFYAGGLVERTGGNINEAARRADLDPANFRRALRRFPRSLKR